RAAADAAELLGSLAPNAARVVDETGERELPVEALLPGMVMAVRAGDTFAADGDVTEGRSATDCSLLTGETRPESVDVGSRVYAGTVNLTGPLKVKVTQAGEMSRLGALLRRMEESARRRAPVVQLANSIAGWFVASFRSVTETPSRGCPFAVLKTLPKGSTSAWVSAPVPSNGSV
ncbi:MAG: hypothetical protein AAB262_14785, partial [Elusimicrobiota bacterium]